MSEMVERVARHIFAANPPSQDDDWDLIQPDWRNYWLNLARAAIAAMREPTEEMIDAGLSTSVVEWEMPTLTKAWPAMIDAALETRNENRTEENKCTGNS